MLLSYPCMNKILLTALLSIFSFNCYSQIRFEQGYFIGNDDEKKECLIKNVDWRSNPTAIEYKVSEEAAPETATIASVKEFGILNALKYKRFSVAIDRSSKTIGKLSTSREPAFVEETLLLKPLVEGAANLYVYIDGNLTRYFYSVGESDVKQLVYKTYLTAAQQVDRNNSYKQQLWAELQCSDMTMNTADQTAYMKADLIRYFIRYNRCVGADYVNLEEKRKVRDLFNFSLRPGINYSSIAMSNAYSNLRDVDFGSSLTFRLGIEAEYVLPFNKNKWALVTEPTYRYFRGENKARTRNVKLDYQSIELPLGFRHYFFLDDKSKLFVNGLYVFDFDFGNKADFGRAESENLAITPGGTVGLGAGYTFKGAYSVELRYYMSRNILTEYPFWTSDYNNVSLVLGYKLF